MKEQQWITDRLPTKEDADIHGDVLIYDEWSDSNWEYEQYSCVKVGKPWYPAIKLPPYEPAKKYWSKPEDIPSGSVWVMVEVDGFTRMVNLVDNGGIRFFDGRSIDWKDMETIRWSDRPFTMFYHGKECLVED